MCSADRKHLRCLLWVFYCINTIQERLLIVFARLFCHSQFRSIDNSRDGVPFHAEIQFWIIYFPPSIYSNLWSAVKRFSFPAIIVFTLGAPGRSNPNKPAGYTDWFGSPKNSAVSDGWCFSPNTIKRATAQTGPIQYKGASASRFQPISSWSGSFKSADFVYRMPIKEKHYGYGLILFYLVFPVWPLPPHRTVCVGNSIGVFISNWLRVLFDAEAVYMAVGLVFLYSCIRLRSVQCTLSSGLVESWRTIPFASLHTQSIFPKDHLTL